MGLALLLRKLQIGDHDKYRCFLQKYSEFGWKIGIIYKMCNYEFTLVFYVGIAPFNMSAVNPTRNINGFTGDWTCKVKQLKLLRIQVRL
jgi:hypothetical protein